MSSNVKVAVAQINCSVGDFEGNSRKIVEAAARAVAAGAAIMVTPELSLTGYPPEDLLLRRAFYAACDSALQRLAVQLLRFRELAVVVGHPLAREGQRYNAASVLQGGVVVGTYCKHDLPNYDVFDEQRYFTPDNRPFVFEVDGTMFGVNICEDTWFHYAPECAQAAGAQVLLVLNASPFHLGKQAQRLQTMRGNVSHFDLPLVYANLVGGQDELVFDGASFVLAANGALVAMAPYFEEAMLVVEFVDGVPQPASIVPEPSLEALAYQALVLGVRDYVGKNGFPWCTDRAVRRRGFRADARDRRRCSGCRPGAGGHDAVAVHRTDEFRGCSNARHQSRRAPRRAADQTAVRCFPRHAGRRVPRTAMGHDGGKPAGPHPWHAADGAVQQVRRDRADDRQQVRDGGRLLDALRRPGRRLRGDQGYSEDARVPAVQLSQFDRRP